MIETPPKITEQQRIMVAFAPKDSILDTMINEINDKYEYWNDIKYKKLPVGISSVNDLWAYIKYSRTVKRITVWEKYGITTLITNYMQRTCHEFDMNFGGSWGTSSIIPDNGKEQYLISSLMEEAISSSQMEGASTTRKVAKDMLRKKNAPKDKAQQMIHNNYQTINFIIENKNQPLCKELLLKIHSLMTEGTLDNPQDAGKFRKDDEVVVANGITNEVVHTPPSEAEIPEFIDDLCKFFNEKDNSIFIHPIIKGIIVHFMIGYMHPFADGNGRTARALFYWYMLKEGYWLTEYMSISRVIARSKKSYENAYLYSECDENDIGYFITYNLRVLDKAFKELKAYIKRKLEEKKESSLFMRIGNINERQAEVIQMFINNPNDMISVKDLQSRFFISPTTAKSDITGLIELGLLKEIEINKIKRGYIRSINFNDLINTKK